MNRILPRGVFALAAAACLLAIAGCSGVGDSRVSSSDAGNASESERKPFDPTVPRTPRPSKSLTMAPDWQPPAPLETPPARVKARVQPPKQWGAPSRPLGPHPSDAEIRAFTFIEDPLEPVPGVSTAEETEALATALRERGHYEQASALAHFVEAYPASRWAPAIHHHIGKVSFERGYFQDALAHWQAGWELAKGGENEVSKDIANLALAESAKMNARIGRMTELDALLAEAQKRNLMGEARTKITSASEGAWMMHNQPGLSFRCGPYALVNIAKEHNLDVPKRTEAFLAKAQSPVTGFSIPTLHQMSAELGLQLQIAKREVGAKAIVPAVVHWKLGHFAALVREERGAYLLKDPTFGQDMWIGADVLDREASGYFLVPTGRLPSGWSPATAAETGHLYGKGNTQVIEYKHPSHKVGGQCQSQRGSSQMAMATYRFFTLGASATIEDTPISYRPAYGPDVHVQVKYSQRQAGPTGGWSETSFGPQFGSNWSKRARPEWRELKNECSPTACVQYEVIHPGEYPNNEKRGEYFAVMSAAPAPVSYRVSFPDGHYEYYERTVGEPDPADPAPPPPTAYLSRIVDPQGHQVTLEYDDTYPTRINRIVDATGLPTEFHYDYPNEPTLVTSIEDPYGRTSTFTYTEAAGKLRLQSIEDPFAIVSSFTYDEAGEVVAMATPYGTTTFRLSQPYINGQIFRWVEATDPLGQTERIEFNVGASTGIGPTLSSPTPNTSIVNYDNGFNNYRNTFYWDKLLMKVAAGDYQKARLYHWAHSDLNMVTDVVESEVPPLEGRIFYNYPGQSAPHYIGTSAFPSVIGRVVKDASGNDQTQATKFAYNSNFNITKVTDPVGRETTLEYAANGIDVLAVRQKTGASTTSTLATYTYGAGAPAHIPVTAADGAGRVTSYTYSSTPGQLLTITNAKNEVTTFTYETNPSNSGYGRVLAITGDVPGGNRTFTYDGYGHVQTATDADGYTLTYSYDSLDRLRVVAYPDGSSEQFEYEDHSLVATKDRAGRWTRQMYNGLMQRVLVQDPELRTTQFQWCRCGDLQRFVDGDGKITEWQRDPGSRVIKKLLPGGFFETYTYDLSGRLSTAVDAMTPPRTTTYKYTVDDRLVTKDYSDTATSDVTYAYDAYFPRVTSRIDGAGTTTFTYQAFGSLDGPGQLSRVNGPLTNDTLKHTYDELGRLKKLEIVDDATQTTASYAEEYAFDARGRVTTVTNNLGSATFVFAGQSSRPVTASYANGMQTQYDYFGSTEDFALKQIKTLRAAPALSVISQFDYTYERDGSIATWKVDQGSGAKTWTFGYDDARQLRSAKFADALGTLLESNTYGYDRAGNRTQVGNGTTAPKNYATNDLNQVVSERDHGRTTFAGTVNEPATVKVNGKLAQVKSTDGGAPFKFEGIVELDAGANAVVVEARDGQDNVSTKTYSVTTTGESKRYEYDGNGNLRYEKQPNGTVLREYRWDQQNRLVKELHGTHESAYEYDGASRRIRITEKENGTQTKDEKFVWCGSRICQKRASNGTTVVRSYFGNGFQESGPTNYFYTRDHLGSVREVVGSDGTTVASRLSYDPWGKLTETGSGAKSDLTYTGHYYDRSTGLALTWFRAYDPNLGRWISRDPLGIAGGLNAYRSVNNNPVNQFDPDGLWPREAFELSSQAKDGGYGPSEAMTEGAVVAAGLIGGAAASTEAGIGLWGALQRMGPVGRFVAGLLGTGGVQAQSRGQGGCSAPTGGTQVTNFGGQGSQQIGVLRLGGAGARLALETRGPSGISHFDLAAKAFGNVGGQQYGLTMIGDKMVVMASSAGPAPVAADLGAIGNALRAAGFENLVAILGPGNAVSF